MNPICLEFQNRILEEAGETPAGWDEHLAGCPVCRAFQMEWNSMDHLLTSQAASVKLPSDFKKRLMSRLPPEQPALAPFEIRRRKEEMEAEYQLALSKLRRRYLLPDPAIALKITSRIAVTILHLTLVFVAIQTARETDLLPSPGWLMTAVAVGLALGTLLLASKKARRRFEAWILTGG